MRFSKRFSLPILCLALLAVLASASAQVPKPGPPHRKGATGCTLQDGKYYFNGRCDYGSGGCYYCEHTNQYGTYGCYEAPNPNDGVSCFAIDYQNY